jgi:hypothetical protein
VATGSEGYNERLFRGIIRSRLHNARFHFLREALAGIPYRSVFELGCFDGRSIGALPHLPETYVGADAGWEGGLDQARINWPQYKFIQATKASELADVPEADVSICMETLEHVFPHEVGPYLDLLQRVTRKALIVTVPVEFGPAFLAKRLVKYARPHLISAYDSEFHSYTFKEVVGATIGKTSWVKRGEHKGFDYRNLGAELAKRFDIKTAEGHPFGLVPGWMNFGFGFVCLRKTGSAPA